MNCPKCGKEMEPGFLYTGHGIAVWTPKPNKWTAFPGRSDELIRDGTPQPLPPACICRACRTVTLEY